MTKERDVMLKYVLLSESKFNTVLYIPHPTLHWPCTILKIM